MWGINGELYFGINNRYKNSFYSTTNVPSTECPNETDRFSINNPSAKLDYQVGLLTADEVILAGVSGNGSSEKTNFYHHISKKNSHTSGVSYDYDYRGYLGAAIYSSNSWGTRPVVSLKSGIEFVDGGDGTQTNPYVVKYN